MDDVAGRVEDGVVVLGDLLLLVAVADADVALEDVGEGVPAGGEGLLDPGAGAELDVEDPDGGVGEVLDGVDAVAAAGDYFNGDLVIVGLDGGDFGGAEVAVARLAGLEVAGQVDPELDADVGAAVGVLARHLGVHDAAAGRHELQVAGGQGAPVAGEVLVVDAAL